MNKEERRKYFREYYRKNKEKILEKQRKWRSENTKEGLSYSSWYYKENKEKINAEYKKWRKENPSKYRQSKKNWVEKNPDYSKNYYKNNKYRKKIYIKENIDKIRDYHREYKANLYKTNPLAKKQQNIRCSINNSLRSGNTNPMTLKWLKTDITGYREWLTEKASNGLDYDNEEVTTDHVVPCSWATDLTELEAVNHYTNTQLLTKDQNFTKSNKMINKDSLKRVLKYHPNPELIEKIIDRKNA